MDMGFLRGEIKIFWNRNTNVCIEYTHSNISVVMTAAQLLGIMKAMLKKLGGVPIIQKALGPIPSKPLHTHSSAHKVNFSLYELKISM